MTVRPGPDDSSQIGSRGKLQASRPAGPRRPHSATSLGVALFVFVGSGLPEHPGAVAHAQQLNAAPAEQSPGPTVAGDAGVASAEPQELPPQRPDLATLEHTTQHLRDFVAGSLDVGLNPRTLFDIDIADNGAVLVEAERLRGVIARAEQARAESPPGVSAKTHHRGRDRRPATAGPDAAVPVADDSVQATRPDAERFAARVELDRARLAFYALPFDRRAALLKQHAERQLANRQAQASARLGEAQQRAEAAEAARRRAVEAAHRARSEAERLVEEERARLLAVSRAQADFEATLARGRLALDQRAEQTLALRRRVREALARRRTDSAAADRLYDELRKFLRASRNELDRAISQISAPSAVPNAGDDRLGDLPEGVDGDRVQNLRQVITKRSLRLVKAEETRRAAYAAQLYDEVDALNRDRLALLKALTLLKRTSVIGLTSGGLDQAVAEVRQVSLVLRYHLATVRRWLVGLWTGGASQASGAALSATLTALKELLLLAAFWWWNHHSDPILTQWRERLQHEERRMRATRPSPLYRFLRFFQRTRRPLEWLILLWSLVWLLPASAREHLEMALATTTFSWTLGGAFVVSTIDALARSKPFSYGRTLQTNTDQLRLRSLRLAGRTAVVLGLVLALSAQLVGKGTVYNWSLSVCWLAAVPVLLVIVRWWRKVIFQRVAALPKKRDYHRWVEAHQTGWQSFVAALSAGVYLFVNGAVKAARRWFTSFDLTRKGLAYLFRRGMDRLAEEQSAAPILQPLPDDVFTTLGPETASAHYIAAKATEDLNEVLQRISTQRGGVFAVVGERGRGKTTILRQVASIARGAVMVDCPATGLEGLRQAIVPSVGGNTPTSIEECAARLDDADRGSGLLIDHAHHLIQPFMGGLADFDRLLQVARSYSRHCTWVVALNEVIWRFLSRARGSRPLFDDVVKLGPWREEEIGQLLASRCKQAGIQPNFKNVMEPLPFDANESDRIEALERITAGYYRMIWDYSGGNPGVALHTWRRSLGLDSQDRVCVRLFRVPDSRELEELPDSAAFVLRAVMQLEPALASDVVRATMLRRPQVDDLLRYGTTRGYFELVADRYRVTWAWFRPIMRFLQRRHLLADF